MPTFGETAQWEEGEYVKLVARDGAAGIVNNHPLKISPQTLAEILSAIKIEPKRTSDDGEDETQPLFSKSKVKSLAIELSEAFKQARPNQDIAFQVFDTSSVLGKLLSKPVYTTGRVFWRNKHLQIIFGSIRRGVAKRRLLGQETGYINPPEVGGRNRIVDSDYKPALFLGSRYAEARNGNVRSSWLIIDPRTVLTQQTNAKQTEKSSDTHTPTANEIPLRDSLERRLKYLKNLRERDLISEQDYRYRVRQIIDEL